MQGKAKWYVVQVCAGREEAVRALICQFVDDRLLDECFVPQYETKINFRGTWVNRTKPLFPGYLIVVTQCVEDVERELRGVPAFTKLLGSEVAFTPLAQEEIAWISAFTSEDSRVVGMSEGIAEGDEITILKGPLMNHVGWIKGINKRKRIAYLEIQMFGRTITTKVGLELVRKKS